MDILTIKNLSKSFGCHKVIDDLSFSVPEHTLFGFLGQNGSGKTTTMKMVLGLLKPDQGEIFINGEKVRYGETKTNRYVGYLPDVPEYYGFMKPFEYLKLCGEIVGLSKKQIQMKSEELLNMVGLEHANKKISSFSRGMKQRLGVAQALLGEPKILICDEPTSALDPIGRKDILDILLKMKGKTTIVFSTHILSDVEKTCDHIAMLNGGKIALSGTMEDLKREQRIDSLLIECKASQELSQLLQLPLFVKLKDKLQINNDSVIIQSNNINSIYKDVFEELRKTSILPIKIELLEPDLESIFMGVVG